MKIKTILSILAILLSFIGYSQNQTVHEVEYKSKPIIKMLLNGEEVWVLLDTGSAISILNIEEKDHYGFKTFIVNRPEFKVPGFGSEANQLHHVRKAILHFGDTQLKRPFFAFDFSAVADSIEARTGKKITAIIGTDMMSTYGFVIDMGNNTVAMINR